LLRQNQGIRTGTSGVLHGWMKDRVTEPEVQAEHHPRRTDQVCNRLKVREGLQGFQPDDNVTGAAGQDFESTFRKTGTRVHDQGTGESGVKGRQLAQQGALDRASLNGIQICDVALVNAEGRMKRAQDRDCVSDLIGYQLRFQRRITAALAPLSVDGNSTGNIENWNDLHRARPPEGST